MWSANHDKGARSRNPDSWRCRHDRGRNCLALFVLFRGSMGLAGGWIHNPAGWSDLRSDLAGCQANGLTIAAHAPLLERGARPAILPTRRKDHEHEKD